MVQLFFLNAPAFETDHSMEQFGATGSANELSDNELILLDERVISAHASERRKFA